MANELKFGNKVIFIGGKPITIPVIASDPGSAVAGDMYFNSTSFTVKIYNGSIWQAMATGSFSLTGQTLSDGEILIGNGSNQSAAVLPSGDATISNLGVVTVAANAISNSKLATMAANTIKGNNTGGAANPTNLTTTQTTAMLNAMVGDSGSGGTKGLVPAPGAGDAAANKFLKADGAWATIPAAGIANVVEDTSPQLGGDLDVNGFDIYMGSKQIAQNLSQANLSFPTSSSVRIEAAASGAKVEVDTSSGITIDALLNSIEMMSDVDMNSKFITGLPAGSATGHAVEYDQFTTAVGAKLENVVEDLTPQLGGILDTQNYRIRDSASNNSYIDIGASSLGVSGDFVNITSDTSLVMENLGGDISFSSQLSMNSNKITNLTDGASAQDAVSFSQMNTADGLRVAKAGDTMSGNLAMGSNKVTGMANGTAANDAVNKSQLDGIAAGLVWLSPILDPDLVDANRAAQPGSPVNGDVYIASATAGDWTTGHAYYSLDSGATWVDLLGRAVIVGDRFGVSMESATAAVGVLSGKDNHIVEITTATPGSVAFTIDHTPVNLDAIYVSADLSSHFGHQYTYSSASTSWLEFGGISAVTAGVGLTYSGNVLSVNLGAGISQLPSDEVGVDVHTSGGLMTTVDNSTSSTVTAAQLAVKLDGSTLSKTSSGLKVAALGITNSEVSASAAIAYSKLDLSASIVNADIATAAAIARSKLASGTNYAWAANNGSGVLTDVAVTASRAVATDANGLPVASATTATELGYVSGVTSSIQTQLGGKLANVVEDLTPELGGDLELNGKNVNGLMKRGAAAATTAVMDDEYLDSLSLTANVVAPTAITALSFSSTTFDGAVLNYKIKEATSLKTRTGQLIIASDGTVTSTSDQFTETDALGAALGLSLSCDISGGNIRVLYNNTHATNAATMRCHIRRFRA